jgi:hypothetical protein
VSVGNSQKYPASESDSADELRDAVARPKGWGREQASPERDAILRRMTPAQRWEAARNLYWTMRRHKAAFLKSQHPDWSEQQVQDEVRRIFAHVRS